MVLDRTLLRIHKITTGLNSFEESDVQSAMNLKIKIVFSRSKLILFGGLLTKGQKKKGHSFYKRVHRKSISFNRNLKQEPTTGT